LPQLYLIRHSLPEIIPGEPPTGWQLSEEGRRRCLILADRLAGYQPERIVTSRELKAVQTGGILAASLGIPCQPADGLHEHVRQLERNFDQAGFERAVGEFFMHPDRLVFGEETANQAHARFVQAVHAILDTNQGKSLAIVTHGAVMSLLICRINRMAEYPYWRSLGMPSISVLHVPDFHLQETIEISQLEDQSD
jgi:broad specificity phosphatase PhoE